MRDRRTFLAGVGGVTGAIVRQPFPVAAQTGRPRRPPAFMYIGSYTTEGRGHGEGISVYHRNSEEDPWSLVQVVKDFADPSFLIIDRQGRCLYAAHGDGTEAT